MVRIAQSSLPATGANPKCKRRGNIENPKRLKICAANFERFREAGEAERSLSLAKFWILIQNKEFEMNMILCGEECRHQKDGYCMLDDLTHADASISGKCKYYER